MQFGTKFSAPSSGMRSYACCSPRVNRDAGQARRPAVARRRLRGRDSRRSGGELAARLSLAGAMAGLGHGGRDGTDTVLLLVLAAALGAGAPPGASIGPGLPALVARVRTSSRRARDREMGVTASAGPLLLAEPW